MAEYILNTGWKQWDKYLSKYVDKKINCLDIGANNGKYTKWLLENLSTNNYSRVFSVDKWDPIIEKEFDTTISNMIYKDRNIKMNMKIAKALLKLKEVKYISFDVIIIGGTLDARKILINTILSWDILAEGGIILFSDYNIGELDEKDLKIKLAIDSFVSIFKPQIKLVYVGYEYIIEKTNERKIDHPELEDYYRLLDEINYLKIDDFKVKFDDEMIDDLEFKLELLPKKQYKTKVIPKIKDRHLLALIFNVDTKHENIYYIINSMNNQDLIYNTNNFISNLGINNKKLIKLIRESNFINYLNRIKSDENICIFWPSLTQTNYNNIYNLSGTKYKPNVTIHNDIIDKFDKYNQSLQLNKKYNYIYIVYTTAINDNHEYNLLFYIGFILNSLVKNGNCSISIITKITPSYLIDIIFLLKHNFLEIKLKNKISTNITRHYIISCNNYINNDISKFNKFISDIYTNNNDKRYNIKTILQIDKNTIIYNNYTKIIKKFINDFSINTNNRINLNVKIYKYITDYKIYNNKIIYEKILLTYIKTLLYFMYKYYLKYKYNF